MLYLWLATIFGYTHPDVALSGAMLSNGFFKIGGFGNSFANFNRGMFGYLSYVYLPLLLIPIYRLHDDTSYSFRKMQLTFAYLLLFVGMLMLQSLIFHSGQLGNYLHSLLVQYIGLFGVAVVTFIVIGVALLLIIERTSVFLLQYILGTIKMAFKSFSVILKKAFEAVMAKYADLNMDYVQRAKKKMVNQEFSERETTTKSKFVDDEPLVERPLDECVAVKNQTNDVEMQMACAETTMVELPEGQNHLVTQAPQFTEDIQTAQDSQNIGNSFSIQVRSQTMQTQGTMPYQQYDGGKTISHTPRTQIRNNEETLLRRFQKANPYPKHNQQPHTLYADEPMTFRLKPESGEQNPMNPIESFAKNKQPKTLTTNDLGYDSRYLTSDWTTPTLQRETKTTNLIKPKAQDTMGDKKAESFIIKEKSMPSHTSLIQEVPVQDSILQIKEVEFSDENLETHFINKTAEKAESGAEVGEVGADYHPQIKTSTTLKTSVKGKMVQMPLHASYKTLDMSFTQQDGGNHSQNFMQDDARDGGQVLDLPTQNIMENHDYLESSLETKGQSSQNAPDTKEIVEYIEFMQRQDTEMPTTLMDTPLLDTTPMDTPQLAISRESSLDSSSDFKLDSNLDSRESELESTIKKDMQEEFVSTIMIPPLEEELCEALPKDNEAITTHYARDTSHDIYDMHEQHNDILRFNDLQTSKEEKDSKDLDLVESREMLDFEITEIIPEQDDKLAQERVAQQYQDANYERDFKQDFVGQDSNKQVGYKQDFGQDYAYNQDFIRQDSNDNQASFKQDSIYNQDFIEQVDYGQDSNRQDSNEQTNFKQANSEAYTQDIMGKQDFIHQQDSSYKQDFTHKKEPQAQSVLQSDISKDFNNEKPKEESILKSSHTDTSVITHSPQETIQNDSFHETQNMSKDMLVQSQTKPIQKDFSANNQEFITRGQEFMARGQDFTMGQQDFAVNTANTSKLYNTYANHTPQNSQSSYIHPQIHTDLQYKSVQPQSYNFNIKPQQTQEVRAQNAEVFMTYPTEANFAKNANNDLNASNRQAQDSIESIKPHNDYLDSNFISEEKSSTKSFATDFIESRQKEKDNLQSKTANIESITINQVQKEGAGQGELASRMNLEVPKEILMQEVFMQDERESFVLPQLNLLQEPVEQDVVQDFELDSKIEKMLQIFNAHKIRGDIIDTLTGPVVTTFEFRPETHVKVSKILSHRNDLARILKAKSIRIQAPIPGKDVIGIQIPNSKVETIYLREILQSEAFLESKDLLTIALGKDISGMPIVANLAKLPHLLVAGTTGSGKSVGVNAIILSLLYRNNPDELKLMMIDPKQVEFAPYEDLPHLITPIINMPNKAIKALQVATVEMDRRYELFSQIKVKNISSYNEKSDVKMPNFVIIIDELADLMITGGKEAEAFIARIAQMGRAAGMHLIIATQRSSVNVITGHIKANLPSRISYRVGSRIDSKVILDETGAEDLLGNGDGLFTTTNGLMRIHAPWVSEQEVEHIVEFIKAQRKPQYDESFLCEAKTTNAGGFSGDTSLIDKAREIILQDNKTSISYLQRKLGIGYNKSASLIEALEQEGFLSAPNSKGERSILQ